MTSIAFLDVDQEDRDKVLSKYPDAIIASSLEECSDAEIISCFIYSSFAEAELDKVPNAKLICTRSVGYDHIDMEACTKRNITVCHVPDYGSHVIAEHVFALLLSQVRHVDEADKRVESGIFDYRGLRGMSLKGKTMGVLGTGKIGRHVIQIAHGFDMTLLATDMCRVVELEEQLGLTYVELPELLAKSDVISLHLPANEKTHHIINTSAFMQMKDDVVLINTARGALIDSTALLEALKSDKVQYALLDVLEHEQNFEENKDLIEHPRVVTTPHIGFYADESMCNMYQDCFDSIDQWTQGNTPAHHVKPLHIVCDLPEINTVKS